jgi:hypothetical protein
MDDAHEPTSTNRTQRRIWSLPGPLLDAVLTFSFDGGEIENLCSGGGIALHCGAAHRPLALLDVLQRVCRQDTPLARRVERTLNLIHADALRERDAHGAAEYAKRWLAQSSPPTRAWAAALWAIGTSTHSGMDCVAARLGRFLTLDALRALCPRMETEGDLRTPTTH